MFLPLLNYTEDGEGILAGMATDISTSYLPEDVDPSVKAGYEAQVEHIVKMHEDRSTAAQELMYVSGGVTLSSILLHPLSRGWVQLNSTDPFDDPIVDPRYLSHPSDGQLSVEAIKYNRKIIATEALQRTGAVETFPGTNVTSDAAILELLKDRIVTVWHPAGTCAMMPRDIGGVVDSELKVYGVENLRVVDASVMPILPAAHMQGSIYAMAEKVSSVPLPFNIRRRRAWLISVIGCGYDDQCLDLELCTGYGRIPGGDSPGLNFEGLMTLSLRGTVLPIANSYKAEALGQIVQCLLRGHSMDNGFLTPPTPPTTAA